METRRLQDPVGIRSDLPWLHCLPGQNGWVVEEHLVTIHERVPEIVRSSRFTSDRILRLTAFEL